jgi:hypothetical protein
MITYIKGVLMKFAQLFSDKNDINEKSIIGFISFAVMVLYAILSIGAGMLEINIPINETIYNSFVMVTLGSFGIAEVGKVLTKNKSNNTE